MLSQARAIITISRKVSQTTSADMSTSSIPQADLESFSSHIKSTRRVLALLGAGLSAASGLPTFRGAGGLWRSHDAVSLATPEAFSRDPGLVWQFYSYRRHMALQAQPNPAHYALAELAKRNRNFATLSQNVDGKAYKDPTLLKPANQTQGSANVRIIHFLSSISCTGRCSTSAVLPSTAIIQSKTISRTPLSQPWRFLPQMPSQRRPLQIILGLRLQILCIMQCKASMQGLELFAS